jgi:outer membrane translocation and assembly module TamA
LEYGFNSGLGLFAGRIANVEADVYTYETRLYRKITDIDSTNLRYIVNGLGFKGFHESLDDYTFPTSGSRVFAKLNMAQNSEFSDDMYGKYEHNIEIYQPMNNKVTIKYRFDYGSFFLQENQAERDPFYIGGYEGFMGYQKYEVSAPFYKIYELGIVYNPKRDLFFNCGIQGLNHANSDIWTPYQNLTTCAYAGIGYRTKLGPLKYSIVLNDAYIVNTYINIGYCFDVFKYAKR